MVWRSLLKETQTDISYLQNDFMIAEGIDGMSMELQDMKFLGVVQTKTVYGKKIQGQIGKIRERISLLQDFSTTS